MTYPLLPRSEFRRYHGISAIFIQSLFISATLAAAGCSTAPVPATWIDPVSIRSAQPKLSPEAVKEGADESVAVLNRKAEAFAPYVRAFAYRVFEAFLISLKRDIAHHLAMRNAGQAEEIVEAEAVFSPGGEIIRFLVNRRPSPALLSSELRLEDACREVQPDPDPPLGVAASDGYVHFVFILTVRTEPQPRGTSYWVQLDAGLL